MLYAIGKQIVKMEPSPAGFTFKALDGQTVGKIEAGSVRLQKQFLDKIKKEK